jgi:hypothetical protein
MENELHTLGFERDDWDRIQDALRFRSYELLQRSESFGETVYGQICYQEHLQFAAIADSIEFRLPYDDLSSLDL